MKPSCVLLLSGMVVGAAPAAALEAEYVPRLPAIVLPLGQKVAVQLGDPAIWQGWIERKAGHPLPPEFSDVAATFKRVGDEMGIFWPGALVQSVLETGYYQYRGDVPRDKHGFNVAGVGITKAVGTREIQDFKTLENGVRAFFQHLQVYAGERPEGEILSNRTRAERLAIAAKVKQLMAIPERGGAAVRFIDLGASPVLDPLLDPDVPIDQRKRTKEFVEMAENYGGTIAGYNANMAAYLESGIGGGGLRYAGDPLYAWKWYSLWNEARTSVEADWRKRQEAPPAPRATKPPWGDAEDPAVQPALAFRKGVLRPQSIYPGADGQYWIYQSARTIYQLPGGSRGWTLVEIKLGKPSGARGDTLYADSEIIVKRNPGKVDHDQEPARYLVIRRGQ